MEAEEYSSWREEVKDSIKKTFLDPLSEASSCMAAVVNSSVKEVRRMAMDAPACRSLMAALKESPSANSFFGNPTDRIISAISNSFMLNSMGSNKSSSSSHFMAASRRFSQPKSSFSNKSSSWKRSQPRSRERLSPSRSWRPVRSELTPLLPSPSRGQALSHVHFGAGGEGVPSSSGGPSEATHFLLGGYSESSSSHCKYFKGVSYPP